MTAAPATSPTVVTRLPPLLTQRLESARRRILAQRCCDWLAACLLAAGALLLADGALNFLRGGAVFRPLWLGLALGAAVMAALAGTAAGWISLAATAKYLDARARTHDRFFTALVFAGRAPQSAFEELTLAECTRFLTAFDVRRWTPILPPRALRYLVVPALALGLLCWHAALGIGQAPADPVLDAAIAQRAAALQTMAEQISRAGTPAKTPDLERLAAELKRSAEHLQATSTASAGDKLKGAMGELSALEAMVAAMKQGAAGEKTSPAELAALSAALAANAPTQAAAQSLQRGKLEQAGAQLAQMLAQLQAQGNAAQVLQQLAQSLQEQAAKLTGAEKNEVARQMQDAAQAAQAGQTQLSTQAMQRLAELLRRLGKNPSSRQDPSTGGAAQPGAALTGTQLQNLLNALENMKAGLPDPGSGSAPGSPQDGSGGEPSLALVESFAPKGQGAEPGDIPSGVPGTEHDGGSSSKLFAAQPATADKPSGPASRLEGVLGEGQSLQALVGANGDLSKASRPYRELYDAMAPAARDAVEQEDIPLGSRFFIRRYFENIRP